MSTGRDGLFLSAQSAPVGSPISPAHPSEEAAMRAVVIGCLVAAFALPLASCSKKSEKSPTDPAAAEVAAQAGDASLASGDIAAANSHYKDALGKDPQSPHAN